MAADEAATDEAAADEAAADEAAADEAVEDEAAAALWRLLAGWEGSWEDAAAFLPVSEVFVDDKASDESLLRRRLPELLFAGGIERNE